jgi:hypothetical protein
MFIENDNEDVVMNDVPETSEENLEEVDTSTSESVEEPIQDTVEETETNSEENIDRLVEERANKMFEEKVKDRLARDRASQERKYNKELAKYKYLESVINAGLGVDNLDDAITKTSRFYKEQGIDIPEFKEGYSERDERILAEADAKEIISLGREEMEAEANRIASIPMEQRTTREKTIFETVCKELINLKDIDELKAKGYKTDILETKDFIKFRDRFNVNTPISEIYEMYNKINGQTVKQPASPGSAKTNNLNGELKDYYTPEEARKFTEEDLERNPKLMAVLEKSMQSWGKYK